MLIITIDVWLYFIGYLMNWWTDELMNWWIDELMIWWFWLFEELLIWFHIFQTRRKIFRLYIDAIPYIKCTLFCLRRFAKTSLQHKIRFYTCKTHVRASLRALLTFNLQLIHPAWCTFHPYFLRRRDTTPCRFIRAWHFPLYYVLLDALSTFSLSTFH